ncbi:hypothetical protein [Hyalangium gracile]|uniref:hypothetical protein n=1 Tax=Hyalangium gracile TaxID=394092 RepID=UPI001CCFFDD4|nr:hypothetical protein [Hyalangium gracile]
MSLRRPLPRGSVLRVVLWIVSIVLLLVVAVAFVADWHLRSKYEPAIGAFRSELKANIGFFCEQQTLLARDPWFHEPRTEGDAGPLLNAWLPWEPQRDMPKDSPLRIPAHLPQSPQDFKDWLTSNVDVSTLDFAWMKRLHAMDRWDLSRNTPTPMPERINWAEASVPGFGPLQLWARFRLLHGLRTGQPLEAARDVRHLAWLSYRTDILLGGAIATVMLRAEREAHDSLPSPPPQWQPMSHEQLDRMRAIIMEGAAFSNVAAPLEVARQARSCGEPVVSRCIALTEAGFMLKLLQPLAEDAYRDVYDAFARDVEGPGCATQLPREAWARGMTVAEMQKAGTENEFTRQLDTLPGSYLSSRISGVLIAVGTPSIKKLKELSARLAPAQPQATKP